MNNLKLTMIKETDNEFCKLVSWSEITGAKKMKWAAQSTCQAVVNRKTVDAQEKF